MYINKENAKKGLENAKKNFRKHEKRLRKRKKRLWKTQKFRIMSPGFRNSIANRFFSLVNGSKRMA